MLRLALLLLLAHVEGRQLKSNRFLSVISKGRFETLAECEKAYDELLGKTQVTTEPDYAETKTEAPTPAPAPDPSPTPEPTPAPLKKTEVGVPEKKDAKPAYHPPTSETGEPSEDKGWDYGDHGDDWAKTEAGAGCSGSAQSPIDIIKYVDIGGQTKSVLWFDYYADVDAKSTATFSNDGHSLHYDKHAGIDIGDVKLGKTEYKAFTWEFHAPAEHTIDGQVFPLELQILHKDASGKMLGVAVLFKYGKSNKFLADLQEAIPSMPMWNVEHGTGKVTVTGANPGFFNLEEILPDGDVHPGGDMTFYNYEGSLTSPPCTGGVDWWVTSTPVDGSRDEIKHVRASILGTESMKHGNNRNAQDLGSRKVLVGHTGFQHHIKMHGHTDAEPPASRGYNTQDAPWPKPE